MIEKKLASFNQCCVNKQAQTSVARNNKHVVSFSVSGSQGARKGLAERCKLTHVVGGRFDFLAGS